MSNYIFKALEDFYSSEIGQIAYKNIHNAILSYWPNPKHETIIGIGFTANFLKYYTGNDNIVASLLPNSLLTDNVIDSWDIDQKNSLIIADEQNLPLADNSVNKILITHSLEYSPVKQQLIREIWRVLAPGGKLLTIVPNKLGIWPHIEKFPFNDCKLFTLSQINNLLGSALFTPIRTKSALFVTSDIYKLIPDLSSLVESWSGKWLTPFGGVLVIESEKNLCTIKTHIPKLKTRETCLNLG